MVKPTTKSNSESQDLLKVLSHCKPKIRNAILKNCENDLIHIICDCVYNVVKGNVPGLTQEKVNKLARHVVMDLMRRVYLSQQEMLKFMKEKQQDSLSPNLRKYYEARQDMNDWLEKDDVPEDTKATMYAQQLQRVNQLKNQVFRPEPSPVQMITQSERTMTSESDSATPSQQLNTTDRLLILFPKRCKIVQNYSFRN